MSNAPIVIPTTILRYSGDAPVVTAQNCSSGSLTGVTVKYQGRRKNTSIWIEQSDVTIEDCIVTGATLTGIEITGASKATITNNRILRNSYSGIIVHGDAKPEIEGNTIENNGLQGNYAGIEVKGRATPTIENNQIQKNGDNGIYVYGKARPNIVSNVITDNPGYGIYISEQAQPALKDNTIKDNKSGDVYRSKQASATQATNPDTQFLEIEKPKEQKQRPLVQRKQPSLIPRQPVDQLPPVVPRLPKHDVQCRQRKVQINDATL